MTKTSHHGNSKKKIDTPEIQCKVTYKGCTFSDNFENRLLFISDNIFFTFPTIFVFTFPTIFVITG